LHCITENPIHMNELFQSRHIGLSQTDIEKMLKKLNLNSLDELILQTIPKDILLEEELDLPDPLTEKQYLNHIHALGTKNKLFTSYIGNGWYDTIMPAVIQRNIYENPSWYTSYTPYQAEISQGRLEALLTFQTAVCEFTGMDIANASLLDEATAAAEAANMMYNLRSREQVKNKVNQLFVDKHVFPQTLAVLRTRTQAQGIDMIVGDYEQFRLTDNFFGAIVQYPNAHGEICDYADFARQVHQLEIKLAVAADILSLALLTGLNLMIADHMGDVSVI
jgi:glycine dehydrogenase